MDLHHKLRRDPNWHKDGCNICGQLGHQAANCTSGTVNWRQIYGDKAFILRPPIYWSEEQAAKKAKQPDLKELERRAREYAQQQATQQGLNYEEMMTLAEQLRTEDPSTRIPKVAATDDELPSGWASAKDPQGRVYYYHKKTMKTQWDKPTEDTPTA